MNLDGKVIVVTGGAHGIGRALCERLSQESPRGIIVADLDLVSARDVADRVRGAAIACDVRHPEAAAELVREAE